MKFFVSQFAYLLREPESRGNLQSLLKYVEFLADMVGTYTVLFHLIMLLEGHPHSWITGLYWTLVVMSTLGFGDITFTSDLGRFFSIIVLLSGVVFLLVMLPFLFIRLFYAPWLEARVRLRAPRRVPETMSGHVIVAEYDAIAADLVTRLQSAGVPYVILEPEPMKAARLLGDAVFVAAGENDSRTTYERTRAASARLVFANCEDTANTNITLTVREVAPRVPILAVVEEDESVDILQLSGATTVLPLKRRLGEFLANRAALGGPQAHVIGAWGPLQIAELPARDTSLAGIAVRDTRLRERTGLSIVGLWERGRLQTAYPHTPITHDSVLVLAGTDEQLTALDPFLPQRQAPIAPLIVIGAGKVGQAAAAALRDKGAPVHVIDRDERAIAAVAPYASAVFTGDAADRGLLELAGITDTPTVLLTTNDDAMNIYLAVFCRRLNTRLRVVSRITHDRNVEAIHRAGADFVLSYTSLGVEAVMSLLQGHEVLVLGEGVELFATPVPRPLVGKPLRDTAIGSRTGLSVVALKDGDRVSTDLSADVTLGAGAELVMIGSLGQRRQFAEVFEQDGGASAPGWWKGLVGRRGRGRR